MNSATHPVADAISSVKRVDRAQGHLNEARVGILGGWVLLLVFALALPLAAAGQGCSQCAEAVGQTSTQTRNAYRRAIVVLMLAGSGIFTATVLTLRRFRQPPR